MMVQKVDQTIHGKGLVASWIHEMELPLHCIANVSENEKPSFVMLIKK